MLVLSRKKGEKLVIGGAITICVVDVRGDKVRLGIEAPKDVPVHRMEVREAMERNEREGRPVTHPSLTHRITEAVNTEQS